MKKVEPLTKEQVSDNNKEIFTKLEKSIGRVPNLYSTFAYSEYGLANYLSLQAGKSSLKAKEKEVINLVVSQYNECLYCLSAHTALAKLNGFTEEQVIKIRKGEIDFDPKFCILAKVVKEMLENKGHVSDQTKEEFMEVGYDLGNLIDIVILVADKTISNYVYALTQIPIDWPEVEIF